MLFDKVFLQEIFDEVDETQITAAWSYDLEATMAALTALFEKVQQVQELEERIAVVNLTFLCTY
jgi:hypothetical protein